MMMMMMMMVMMMVMMMMMMMVMMVLVLYDCDGGGHACGFVIMAMGGHRSDCWMVLACKRVRFHCDQRDGPCPRERHFLFVSVRFHQAVSSKGVLAKLCW